VKVARVVTNETCNQACAFCVARRPSERASVAAAEAVLARIDAAARAGAREIVLTGGEPTLRRDLPVLVGRAKRGIGDAPTVVLETNGALIDPPRARTLARAGLDRARVHLPAWGEACDAITRDEGGFERARLGIAALVEAGIAVESAAPVVRATADRLPALPRALVASAVAARALVLGVPVEAPDPATLLAPSEAARVVERVVTAAREVGLAVRLDPAASLAPCLFAQPAAVAQLFSLTKGGGERPGFSRVGACDACALLDRCPGLPTAALAREPALTPRPVTEERTRRRLSLVASVEEQAARELVTRELQRLPGGEAVPAVVVRVVFHCNQACSFCFVSTHLPPPPDDVVERAIVEAARSGAVVTLSGGEPTLAPRLLDHVRLARAHGARHVALQTNAVRLAEGTFAQDLVEAGVDWFHVSLHASDARTSDALTAAPGTWDATCRGVDAIHRAGATLLLNYVFSRDNAGGFPAHVRAVAARWPGARVTVSFVAASTDVVPREVVPRYADVLPELAEGVRVARELGVSLDGFESMCGLPLCLVPGDLAPFFALAELPPGLDAGELVKPDPCSGCALSARCFGVRRSYVERWGSSELRPVVAPPGGTGSSPAQP
jgi:molybdenum cofactor biosynthesis enzyme MoaA